MKRHFLISTLLIIVTALPCIAQNVKIEFKDWTLDQCLNYAFDHNIDVLQSIITESSSVEDLERSKQAFAPNISASTSQGFTYRNMLGPDNQSVYNASYGINLNMPIFQGGKLLYTKKQNEIILSGNREQTNAKKIQVESSVLKAYLQVLYDNETVKTNEKIFELSDAEYERSKVLYEVGKITKSSLMQVASQWASNKYNLTLSKNTLRTDILSLKQLLELDLTVDFSVAIPEIDDAEILEPLPDMIDIFNTSMEVMPEVKAAKLNLESANMSKKVAQSAWMPTVNLNAGLSGSYNTTGSTSLGEQFKASLGPTVGLSVNIPIYDQRSAKTSVNKAKLSIESSKLKYEQTEKEISKNVETLYVEALNAQENYITAKEKLEYAQVSYELVAEQFNIGMKNTVELLTEEKNLFSAEQAVVQCRYKAIISIQLLNILQDKPIKVGK